MRIKVPEIHAGDIGRYGKIVVLAVFYIGVLVCLADGIVDVVLSQRGNINGKAHKAVGQLQDPNTLINGVIPARR